MDAAQHNNQRIRVGTESQGWSRRATRWTRLGALWLVLLNVAQCGWSKIDPTNAPVIAGGETSEPDQTAQPSTQANSIRVIASRVQLAPNNAQAAQSTESDFDKQLLAAGEYANTLPKHVRVPFTEATPSLSPVPQESQSQDIAQILEALQKSVAVANTSSRTPIRIKLESAAPIPSEVAKVDEAPAAQIGGDLSAPTSSQLSVETAQGSSQILPVTKDCVEPRSNSATEVMTSVAKAPIITAKKRDSANAPTLEGNYPATVASNPPSGENIASVAATQPIVAESPSPVDACEPPVAISEPVAAGEQTVDPSQPAVDPSQPAVAVHDSAVIANTPVVADNVTANASQSAVVASAPTAAATERLFKPDQPASAVAQSALDWDASSFAAPQRSVAVSEIRVKQAPSLTAARYTAAVSQVSETSEPTPSDSPVLPAPANAESIPLAGLDSTPMPLTNSSFLPANPESYCYRCGVKCPPGGCQPGGPGWAATRPIPWEVYAQGEYIGPARLAHVPIYRLRVDDSLAFVYRLSGQVASQPYRLNVRDRIQVQSLSAPEVVNRELIIQPDGTITLPLLGQVRAAGTTVEDLGKQLDELFKNQIKDPRITVTPLVLNSNLEELRSSVDRRYGQGGQVRDGRVSPDGTIQLPAIGSVPAQGMTLEELEREVKTRYARIVEGLEVTPILLDRAPRYIYVVGEVRLPGRFTMEGPTTLMQAVALAGSWNVGAQLNNVVVFRRDENWQLMATKVDIRSSLLFKKPCPSGEIWLRDSDIVLIPKSPILCADDVIELVFTRGIYGVFPMNAQLNFSKLSTL